MTANVVLVGPPRVGARVFQSALMSDPAWGQSELSTSFVVDEARDVADEEGSIDPSHRLLASDLTPAVQSAIEAAAQDVDSGVDVAVDWQPRWGLRLGLLAEALPDAKFVMVVRRPVPTIASLMEAWRSGRFATDRHLEGWWGEAWSFPVIPGWQDLIGKPPAEVCSAQWAYITSAMLDDLESLDDQRWTVASYEGLIENFDAELQAVTEELGLPWVGSRVTVPALSSAVSPPDPGKWTRNWSEIAVQMDTVRPVAERLHSAALAKRSNLPWPELQSPKVDDPAPVTIASAGTPFSSVHTPSIASLIESAGRSLLVTTYKSGHVIIARATESKIDTEFTSVNRPMGIAVAGGRLAIGSSDAVLSFSANRDIAPRVPSPHPVDVAYTPRSVIFTGDVAIHDMSYGSDEELYFINTRFSCLSRLDMNNSFDPIWRPAWISSLAPEDRCHLNGLAMRDGKPRYVTALSQTDVPNGWRESKGTSGVVVDVTSDAVIASGLSMPHSPRWHDGRLWVLESGKGSLATVDLETGSVTTVATLPGFTRGLTFLGPYALIGLSQVRESVFTELPITAQQAERNCGVWAVDTRSGAIVGFLRFEGVVQEIFEVQTVLGRWPAFVDQGPLTQNAFVLPDAALAEVRLSVS